MIVIISASLLSYGSTDPIVHTGKHIETILAINEHIIIAKFFIKSWTEKSIQPENKFISVPYMHIFAFYSVT